MEGWREGGREGEAGREGGRGGKGGEGRGGDGRGGEGRGGEGRGGEGGMEGERALFTNLLQIGRPMQKGWVIDSTTSYQLRVTFPLPKRLQ